MARFRRRLRGAAKPVHPTKWCGMDFYTDTETVSNTDHVAVLCSSTEFETFANPTVVRIRGWVELSLGLTADNDAVHLAEMSLGIRTQDIQVIAAGSLNTKNVQESDWMWLNGAHLFNNLELQPVFNSSGTVTGDALRARHRDAYYRRFEVDVRAMRRVPQNHQLILHWTVTDMSADTEVRVSAQLRTLIKE